MSTAIIVTAIICGTIIIIIGIGAWGASRQGPSNKGSLGGMPDDPFHRY